jgi:transposase
VVDAPRGEADAGSQIGDARLVIAVFREDSRVLAAEGYSNVSIARELGVGRPTVIECRKRFGEEGVQGLTRIRPGRGRPARISPEKVAEIVHATLHEQPEGETHWSCRLLAKATGVSPATVQRIWDQHNLKPWRTGDVQALKRQAVFGEAD